MSSLRYLGEIMTIPEIDRCSTYMLNERGFTDRVE